RTGRGQITREAFDVLGLADPADERLRLEGSTIRGDLQPPAGNVGHERTGGNTVDQDAIGAQLHRHLTDEVVHAGLGRHVGCADDHFVDLCGDGRGDDYAATARALHVARGVLYGRVDGAEIDIDDPVP